MAESLRDTDEPFDDKLDPALRALVIDDAEEAELEGDRPFAPGTARAALASVGFRRVWTGWLASNIGTWMQNVVLQAYAYNLTKSPFFVSIVVFAQLGPLLLFSLIGGSLADRFDRRKLIMLLTFEQLLFALVLAWIGRDPDPNKTALVMAIFAIGCGQALVAPVFNSMLPNLVRRRDLPGAVSLMSFNMNISRVVGSAIGGVVFAAFGVAWVFAANAVSYLAIVVAVATVLVPRVEPDPTAPRGLRRILQGFSVARADKTVGRVLITCATFSFFCLIFVGQMPTIAAESLGINEKSAAFGVLYATFGIGAAIGAIFVGSIFAGRDLTKLVRVGLVGFAFSLAVFSIWRAPGPAYPTIFVLGWFYFLTITSLSTVLQQRLDDRKRGRVMAIWIMAFGGTVPIGNIVFGPVVEAVGPTPVLLMGAVFALGLAWYCRLQWSAVPVHTDV